MTSHFMENGPMTSYLVTEIAAGGISGMIMDFLFFPLDTMKTRIQTVQTGGRHINCGHIYKGLMPTLFIAFPNHGSYFLAYEYTKYRLQKSNYFYLVK